MALQNELIDLIKQKASQECGSTALLYASTYINQLRSYIDGNTDLSESDIYNKIDYLAGCLTITLTKPVNDLELLRVRVCEDDNFSNIDDLSYIKHPTNNFPSMGRLNKTGEVLFYASIALHQSDRALRTVLSEARVKDLDKVNVLRSHQKTDSDINLRMIGIWDKVRRDDCPYYLSSSVFDYYKEVMAYMEKRFEPKLLCAYALTDRFFDDLLSRKGTERLYQVTSEVSSLLLHDTSCHGILYSSVEAKGEAVIALKPEIVDCAIEHINVTQVHVEKCFGYEFFEYKTLALAQSIEASSGLLTW